MAGPSEYQVALTIIVGTDAMLMFFVAIVFLMVIYHKRMIQEQRKRQQIELGYQQKLMEAALESQENNASVIQVTVAGRDKFELIVGYNGMGLDVESLVQYLNRRTGLGLFNIENPDRALNATLQMEASEKKESKITMTMPL